MKGIGIFVALLLAAMAVTIWVVSRPPDRTLDAADRGWVSSFETWTGTTEGRIDRARIAMTFASNARNARLIEPLRACAASLTALGDPPAFLVRAHEIALEGCGRAQHAVGINERFGVDSLATTKLHLNEAGDRLALARRTLRVELAKAPD